MSSRNSGFTLIEVLITAFVLGVVTVALTGLSLVVTRSSLESERQEVAINVATERLENLHAAFQSRGYEVVEFKDISPQGVIERDETIARNNLEYNVKAFIHIVDDPANGLGQADFKTVLYKVTWASNISQAGTGGELLVAAAAITFSPDSVFAASEPSAVVAAVAVYTQAQGADDSCVPGTDTCENPDLKCTPGAQNACSGQPCPPTGLCPGDPQYVTCPADGRCSSYGTVPPPQLPQPGLNCPNGIQVIGNTAEVCDVSAAVCNDGINNDNDIGADDPFDPQCQQGFANVNQFGERALFEEDYVDAKNCLVRYRKLGTISTQSGACQITRSCGTLTYVWKEIPGCVPQEESNCQEEHDCDQGSWCIKPPPAGGTCTGDKCCPQEKGICGNGLCWECLAGEPVNQDACDLAVKGDPNRGNGEDDWCSRNGGCECEPETNKCVQCLDNNGCPFLTEPFCVNQKCQENPACADGKDNDNDRKIDWNGGGGDGGPIGEPDPGCTDFLDNDERDFIVPPPQPPKRACSDGGDNDEDGLIDFPADPGCDDGADFSEEDGPGQVAT